MAARNRVFDSVAGSFVFWETDFPDPLGAQYPGPATFGSGTLDYCVTNGVKSVAIEGPAQLLDETFSPVALYKLNGNLDEETGSGPAGFSTVGVEQYTDGPITGTQAHKFNGSTYFTATTNLSATRLLGDMSFEAILRFPTTPPGSVEVMGGCEGTSGTSNNGWYLLAFSAGSSLSGYESPANVFNSVNIPTSILADGEWHHVLITRNINGGAGPVILDAWVDGILVASFSTANLPSGGSTAIFRIGCNAFGTTDAAPANSEMSSFKIIDRRLSQSEIIAEYKRWQPELER